MSGCELVEVRNVADAVGLVLSKRSDTMRRQARKRYLQVVERNGGPGRDRTDDLFHAMEARSQLRHRPTLKEGVAIILAQQYALVKHPQVGAMTACSTGAQARAEWKQSCQTCENEYSE